MPHKNGKPLSNHQLHGAEYKTWINALHRCHNPNNLAYKSYGARGITVSDDWRCAKEGFNNFLRDLGKRPAGDYSLERKNGNKGYSKENCVWADRKTQQNNLTRYTPKGATDYGYGCDRYGSPYLAYNGKIRTLSDWSMHTGIKSATIRQRLQRGVSVDEALSAKSLRNAPQSGVRLRDLLIHPQAPNT